MDRFGHIHFFDESPAALIRSCPPRRPCLKPRHSAVASADALDVETRAFLAWVLERSGLALDSYRPTALARRLRVCLRNLQANSVHEARLRLEQHPDLLPQALSALLLGVTQFFRDPAVFSYLRDRVLPIWHAESCERQIWSAGCANGAELYSLAMLLDQEELLATSWLLGTDCREDALEHARRGHFTSLWELNGIPAEWHTRYLSCEGPGWCVNDSLRRASHWAQENLLTTSLAEESRWDLILCRNVAIYLEPTAAARLWSRLVSALRPGGILVTGKAERPQRHQVLLRLAPCVFQRLSGGTPCSA